MKNLKSSRCEVLLQQYSDQMYSATIRIGNIRYKFFSKQKSTAEKVYTVLLSNCFFNENLINVLFPIYRIKIEQRSKNNFFVSQGYI
jgi:hypothetical protein